MLENRTRTRTIIHPLLRTNHIRLRKVKVMGWHIRIYIQRCTRHKKALVGLLFKR